MSRTGRLFMMLLATLSTLAPAGGLLADNAPPLSRGQSIYIPIYSHIYYGNLRGSGEAEHVLLSSMLSVRNTDPSHAMQLVSVKYYDTMGRVIREYLTAPRTVSPLASSDFFVEHQDKKGGSGAHFIVTWSAERLINQPLMESINAYVSGTKGMTFVSRGQTLHTTPLPPPQDHQEPGEGKP